MICCKDLRTFRNKRIEGGAMSTIYPTVAQAHERGSGLATDDPMTHYSDINANLDALLTAARPRLLRLARLQGIAPDIAEDVVQETVFTAWRRLSLLRRPDRFDAWLDGICRNLCRLQHREQRAAARRQVRLAATAADEWCAADEREVEVRDTLEGYGLEPTVADPVEDLSQDDLAGLLDRALGYLPDSVREVLEICCLERLPQRQAALQLGLTIGALEVRLHRARRRLCQVLSRDLRAEAEAFGLQLMKRQLAVGAKCANGASGAGAATCAASSSRWPTGELVCSSAAPPAGSGTARPCATSATLHLPLARAHLGLH
jgi:RNA polymerase sigma factor (sigma-70 family)